ncbi:MAG TPA: mycothiol synthase [Dermatophilaceae bacterium]|nr:mycothiol synthase [Dermatophilaceae bacterium]
MVIVQVDHLARLTHEQRSAVLGLVKSAAHVDEVAPLSEQVLLAVRDSDPVSAGSSDFTTGSRHFLAYADPRLVGYAHLEQGRNGGPATTAEIVVDPSHRRQGVGTALLRALEHALAPRTDPGETLHLWSHGDLDCGRAFAHRAGYSMVRELWQMRRPLRSDIASLPAVILPEGFRTRHFVVGQDEEAWLRVNAHAFVDHPEQGRMTRHDLDRRIAEPWFDASGFILIEDMRALEPVLAASHWTKVVPADGPTTRPTIHPAARPTEGEVYVVGVDPAYQGMGLGRIVTVLGLAHLREKGLTEAMLYVDADNRAAVSTYSKLDFARSAVDIMYSRIVHTPM